VVLNRVGAIRRDLVPVDNIPPVGNILGSTVLVLEVVRMLPDIQSQNGEHDSISHALHERVVLQVTNGKVPVRGYQMIWYTVAFKNKNKTYLVGRTDQLEFITCLVDANPHPARSKESTGGSAGFKLRLHFIQTAKGLVDELFELRTRFGLLGLVGGCHFLPEKGVIVVATAIVANRRAGVNGTLHEIENGNFGLAFGRLVNVGDVSTVVLVVVDFHCGSVNEGFEGFEGIGQVGDGVGIGRVGADSRNSGNHDSGSSSFEPLATRSGGRGVCRKIQKKELGNGPTRGFLSDISVWIFLPAFMVMVDHAAAEPTRAAEIASESFMVRSCF
jgi:hypothetical protein